MAYAQRGLEQRQEQDPGQLIRDTRTIGQRLLDFMKSAPAVAVTLGVMATTCFIMPGLSDIMLLFGILLFTFAVTRKTSLPYWVCCWLSAVWLCSLAMWVKNFQPHFP